MDFYNEIKKELINNEINRTIKSYSINRSDLNTYYNVGKMLSEAGKHYGEGIIKEYSKKLTSELGKNYTKSSLYNMLKFYELSLNFQTLSGNLSWSHYCELLWINDINKINYYINISIIHNLSVRQLREKIKSKEYERLPNATKEKLINRNESNIVDLIKNPIIIRNNNHYEIISEKILQKLVLEDIDLFMNELGIGFSYVGNEYKIKLGDRYNYIDLLLFNIEYNCYVVIELKITELKKEHIGQIQVYMNYIDSNIKKITQDKTIGIIICRKNNKYIIEYCSDDRIRIREYKII